jgi:hypothetical protein
VHHSGPQTTKEYQKDPFCQNIPIKPFVGLFLLVAFW